jgi:hypothetical protein
MTPLERGSQPKASPPKKELRRLLKDAAWIRSNVET